MHDTNTSRSFDEYTSVEEAWRDIFTDHDVDEAQADLFVKLTFGTPRLTRGAPHPDDIPDIVADSLDNVHYEEHLHPDSDPDQVRTALMTALDFGIRGEIGGPASAPEPVARSGLFDDDRPVSIPGNNLKPEIGGDRTDTVADTASSAPEVDRSANTTPGASGDIGPASAGGRRPNTAVDAPQLSPSERHTESGTTTDDGHEHDRLADVLQRVLDEVKGDIVQLGLAIAALEDRTEAQATDPTVSSKPPDERPESGPEPRVDDVPEELVSTLRGIRDESGADVADLRIALDRLVDRDADDRHRSRRGTDE